MKNYLKQFMVWATVLKSNKSSIFEDARLKLTFFYMLTMIIVMGIFSLALFNAIRHNFTHRPNFQREILSNPNYPNPIDDVRDLILYIDGVILIIITGLSYALAGRTLRPIKEALDAQKRFSADASHDLRTPLSIMITESEVLLQSSSKNINDYKEVVVSNLQEAKKISSLADDLLAIARSEDGVVLENLKDIDIQDLIKRITDKIAIQAKDRGITLSVLNKEKIKARIYESYFERALQNILQNALKYTNDGGQIIVESHNFKSEFKIKIQDTGVGIKSEDLPRVFNRFYKGSLSRSESGFGLGLPIAKQVVESHGGRIEIESKEGEGTLVSITIPKS